MVSGPWRQWRPSFFVHASLSSNHPCFERQMSKTRRYTNVVCCGVKIPHLELFPGSSAVPKLLGANAGGYMVRSHTAILKTFFPAKTRKRYYRIHTSVAPNPQTHIPAGGMHVVVVGRPQAPPTWEPPPPHGRPPPPTPSSPPPPPPQTAPHISNQLDKFRSSSQKQNPRLSVSQ